MRGLPCSIYYSSLTGKAFMSDFGALDTQSPDVIEYVRHDLVDASEDGLKVAIQREKGKVTQLQKQIDQAFNENSRLQGTIKYQEELLTKCMKIMQTTVFCIEPLLLRYCNAELRNFPWLVDLKTALESSR